MGWFLSHLFEYGLRTWFHNFFLLTEIFDKTVLPDSIFKFISSLLVLVWTILYVKSKALMYLKAYCILRNISQAKYSCEIFRNLRYYYVNCCFGIKLWSFTHKKTSKKKDNSHIFNMVTKKWFIWYFGFLILI